MASSDEKRHVVLFPFMSKGHTIPLLQLSHLFLGRGLIVTIYTTPANLPFIQTSLSNTSASIISLPFPSIPGVENTENLPSMSLFPSFALSTEVLLTPFYQSLEALTPPPSFLVSDGFLWWTQLCADNLSVPRYSFYGMSCYAVAVTRDASFASDLKTDAVITVPSFPWIKVTRSDFDPVFVYPDRIDPVYVDFISRSRAATARSSGIIVNSFREIESVFADYWDYHVGPKSHYLGPLCLVNAETDPRRVNESSTIHSWLNSRSEVMYVAFGSQPEISPIQIGEIASGLEESDENFLWVLRKSDQFEALPIGFEERVRETGLVVRDWVDQREILNHESVIGFFSHCGWNSVMESVCAAVPMLTWPISAEQPLNAKMVTEEMGVGLRVEGSCFGGFGMWEEVRDKVKELMRGERGREVRERVKEVAAAARMAFGEGGSSWRATDSLLDEACTVKGG